MRLGPQFQRADTSRTVHTLGYIQRPRMDRHDAVPMPSDPHRAPKNALSAWPTQRGKR
jgi:hypothetical protein